MQWGNRRRQRGGAGCEDVVGARAGGIDEVGTGVDVVEAGVFVMVRAGIERKSRPAQICLARLRWTPALWSSSSKRSRLGTRFSLHNCQSCGVRNRQCE